MWTPLIKSSPDVRGNGPDAYWPGKNFVDWVGTDACSRVAAQTAYSLDDWPKAAQVIRHELNKQRFVCR